MMGIGGVVLLIASFAIGALINSDGAPEDAPAPITDTIGQTNTAAPVTRSNRADVTLVPVTDADTPITTAPVATPAEGVAPEYQRSDATAVSSIEYAQLAARAQEEKKRNAALVDPRSLTGPAYAQAQARPQPAPPVDLPPQTSAAREDLTPATPRTEAAPPPRREENFPAEPARVVTRTRPIPISQPLPDIKVSENATARLDLMVSADGRVQSVNLRQGIPGQTAQLISTVQRWRFKPATENGQPVAAPFTVDISFRGND